MFHAGVLREAENASVGCNNTKLLSSEQKLPKMKKAALGDVQNTLHSRTLVNANTHSGVKAPSQFIYSKCAPSEKLSSVKRTGSGRIVNVTPTKSSKKLFSTVPDIDGEMFEIHNHILCEQDHQFYINDFLKDYKFSEEQIKRLAHSVKSNITPLSVELYEPCEDIDIPCMRKFNENCFSVSDIFGDISALTVPAPPEML